MASRNVGIQHTPRFWCLLFAGFLTIFQFKLFVIPRSLTLSKKPLTAADDQDLHHHQPIDRRSWVETREQLCPNGLPNLTFSKTLFDLARYELNLSMEEYNATTNVSQKFFHGWYTNEHQRFKLSSNSSLAYIRIFKGGNNHIMGWQKRAFPEMEDDTQPIDPTRTCIVTAIRDPVSHFLSGYNEIEYRWLENKYNHREERHKESPSVPYMDQSPGTPERFHEFVFHLVKEHASYRHYQVKHVFPMSRILTALNENGLKLTGYLPSIANLSSTWPEFLSNTCPNIPVDLPTTKTYPKIGHHKSSNDPKGTYQAAKDVWNSNGPTSRAICVLHAIDYACFPDLPDGIPVLCQDVYGSIVFTTSIFS